MPELAVAEPQTRLPAKRGRGRPPGAPNKTTRDVRETIIAKGKPVEFLCDIVRGRRTRIGPQAGPGKAEFAYPSFAERMRAAEILIDKVVPSMKAAEITGADGAPLIPAAIADDGDSTRFAAMWLAHMLREARESGNAVAVDMLTGLLAGGGNHDMAAVERAIEAGLASEDATESTQGVTERVSDDAAPEQPTTVNGAGAPPEPPERPPEPGDKFDVPDANDAFVRFAERLADGRERWMILRCDGLQMETRFSREAAEARARELAQQRKI